MWLWLSRGIYTYIIFGRCADRWHMEDVIQLLFKVDPLQCFTFCRFSDSCRHWCPGRKHWQHIWSKHGMCWEKCRSRPCGFSFPLLAWTPVFPLARTLPWPCTWGITGRMTAWRFPPATTRVGHLIHVLWRKSGFLTCSLSTLSVPSSMIQRWKTSCWGFIPMATSFTVSGKLFYISFALKFCCCCDHLSLLAFLGFTKF